MRMRRFAMLIVVVAMILPMLSSMQAALAAPSAEPAAFNCADVSQIPQSECQALEAFYNSTNGADWR